MSCGTFNKDNEFYIQQRGGIGEKNIKTNNDINHICYCGRCNGNAYRKGQDASTQFWCRKSQNTT